jgi:hypothetical protein
MLTGPFKIQRLETCPRADAVAAGKLGRISMNVAAPKRRRALAEQQAIVGRIDDPNALIRVWP